MSQPRHSISVAAVVTDDAGRVLVVQRRDNQRWEIPGGILELGESLPAGVRREVEEETGIVVEPGRLTGVYKNLRLGVVALVFLATKVGGEARATEESATVEWWSADDVAARMGATVAVRVADALEGGDVAIRVHDGVRLLTS